MDQDPSASGSALGMAALLKWEEGTARLWSAEELGPILRHQLETPLVAELGPHGFLPAGGEAPAPPPATFAALLLGPDSPVALLEKVKQFSKWHYRSPESPLPREVASTLYYASLAAALVHCGKRITEMGDADLRRGLEWCRQQDWIEPRLKDLMAAALAALAK